ncbi:MAG: 6-bladed beta-propeller [Tannerellaceae bacterium]|jgi:hypothetical protein|nr:6-bladed beta-propeller [Tannerellaceae bacterium]
MKLDNLMIIIFCTLIVVSCKNNNIKDKSYMANISIEECSFIDVTRCALQENIDILGGISSINFIDDKYFVIATEKPSEIFIYNINGRQIKKIDKNGDGPYEYITPSIIRTCENKIYVWCKAQLKLIVYDIEGNGLGEHRFDRAINNFIPYNNFVSMYVIGDYRKPFIKIFDLKNSKQIHATGIVTNEQILLNIMYAAGGISVFDDNIYYISSDKLEVKSININTFKEESIIKIKSDPEFVVKTIKEEPANIINNNKPAMIDYLNNNSIVSGIFTSEEYIIILSEVGVYNQLENNRLETKRRYNKFYVLDRKSPTRVYAFKKSIETLNSLYTLHNNNLFYIKEDFSKEDMRYELREMSLEFK